MTFRDKYETVLSDPSWFLSGVDSDGKKLLFCRTSEARIRQLSFLDGRDPVAVTAEQIDVPIRYALDFAEDSVQLPPAGFIMHTSFCGSTLLANLVQASTNVLVYREPNCLVELANLKAQKHKLTENTSYWHELVKLVVSQLNKSWAGVPVVVKPSNWANTLLPELSAFEKSPSFVIATMPEMDFLLANLRGGKARLGYSLNLLNHYLASGQASRADVLAVERVGFTPIGRLLRLLVILHRAQADALDRYLPGSVRFELNKIQNAPSKVLEETGFALGLKMDAALAARAVQTTMPRHAKAQGETFEVEVERAETQRLYAQFADEFASLTDWRDDWAAETA